MAAPSLTYTLTNGSTADASQVMQNFNDLLNGYTDGTKDLSISALTCAGTATLNGNVAIGNASADDLTITASLASSIPIKTTNSYDIGSSTLGLRALYFGANSQTCKIQGSSSMSATWTLTLPVSAGTANYALTTDGSGVGSWTSVVLGSMNQYNIPIGNSSNAATNTNTNLIGDGLCSIVSTTVTMTIATPCVVTHTSHGLKSGDRVYLTTTGALPTGVSASTSYYVTVVDANSYKLSTSFDNMVGSTYVASSGSQSGTHTAYTGGIQVTGRIFSPWTAFTPTIGNLTGTKTGYYRREGDSIRMRAHVAITAGSTGTLDISILSGTAIDYNKIPGSPNRQPLGTCYLWDASAAGMYTGTAIGISGTGVRFYGPNAVGLWSAGTTPVAVANGDEFCCDLLFPTTAFT